VSADWFRVQVALFLIIIPFSVIGWALSGGRVSLLAAINGAAVAALIVIFHRSRKGGK
jgi:uncharacterized membrane protein